VGKGRKFRRAACGATLIVLGSMLLFVLLVPRSARADQISHDPIYINGNDNFTLANGVVGGSGIENDPYVIENWILDAVSANGIWIENTTAYFVIRNCLVKNTGTGYPGSSYNGIFLDNATNGLVINNSCNSSWYGVCLRSSSNDNVTGNACDKNAYGIYLDSSANNNLVGNTCTNSRSVWSIYTNREPGLCVVSSSNNVLSNNNCSNNSDGISLDSSSNYCVLTGNNCSNNNSNGISLNSYNNYLANNTCSNNSSNGIYLASLLNNNLTGNTCSNNSTGIYLTSSSDIDISNNTCLGNSSCGIYLESSSLNNNLTGNTCSNNSTGIYLTSSSNNNIVSNNTCSKNSSGQGVYTRASSSCIISNNTFLNNRYGVYLTSSSNCAIFNNYILNNTENNAYDDGSNSWDNSGIGNYWSDWQPPAYPENDNSGIISVPRPIAGGTDYDYYPLVLADFSISLSQNSGIVTQGRLKTIIVTLTPYGNFSSTVNLSVSGLPPGAACTFAPPSGTPSFTSTLTISATSTTPTGTYIVTITGTGGGDNHSIAFSLTIAGPSDIDFTISVTPASESKNHGESTTATVSLSPLNDFDSTVSLSVSGLPSGATYNFAPSSGTPSFTSTLTIFTSQTTPVGSYPINITGTGGGMTGETTYTLTVTTLDFTINTSPTSGSINRSESTAATVSLSPINGFDNTVSLSASGLPSGATANFTPSSGTPSFASTLTISTASTTPVGTYSITINGTGGGMTHGTTYTLTVTTPDFTISVNPTIGSQNHGEYINATVSLSSINGFDNGVSLSASGLPSGAVATFAPSSGTPSFASTLTISTAPTTPIGTYLITITGNGGGMTHGTTYTLTVTTPDFTISVIPLSGSKTQGESITTTVSLSPINGFDNTVSLSVSGLPPDASYTFEPSSGRPSFTSTLTISTASTTPTGSCIVTITGIGGGMTHACTYLITVSPPGRNWGEIIGIATGVIMVFLMILGFFVHSRQ
jgi:parallel beta-helix repeat protein